MQQNVSSQKEGFEDTQEEADGLGVEVVVLQTATSWRGVQGQQPRIRRSAAGELPHHGQNRALLQLSSPHKPQSGPVSKQAGQWQQFTLVLMACMSWILASSGAILVNKHIMVDLHFPYPATVCAIGLLGTSLVSYVAVKVLQLAPATQVVSVQFFMTKIMPIGLFQALSMQLGNTAYLHLSVAFVQMLKAFTPVSTMLFAFAFRLERPTAQLITSVGLITAGVVAVSYGEGNFSMVGVGAMLTSIVCEGLRLVMMQTMVAKRTFHPLEALMYLAPAAGLWVLLIALFSEALQMHQDGHMLDILKHPGYLAASAVAGFGVNAMAMAVISLASALTLKVLGICKDIALVMFGVAVLSEHVTQTQLMGYGFSVLGLVWYNAVKAWGAKTAAAGAASSRRSSARGSVPGAVVHHTVHVATNANARR